MKLAIMQPYFFPYIGYYQAIAAVDKFILYDEVSYIKKGWINKNRILIVNREPFHLIIPVKERSSYRKIKDIELTPDKTWRKNILNIIYFNYKKAPFFEDIYPLIEQVINSDTEYLSDFNAKTIIDVSNYLDIPTEIITNTNKFKDLEDSLSQPEEEITELFPLTRIDAPIRKIIRVLEICREEGATEYINAIGGQALYNKDEFAEHGIKLSFVKTNNIIYCQQSNVFHPNLSIIDVLFNCGKDGTNQLIKNYELI